MIKKSLTTHYILRATFDITRIYLLLIKKIYDINKKQEGGETLRKELRDLFVESVTLPKEKLIELGSTIVRITHSEELSDLFFYGREQRLLHGVFTLAIAQDSNGWMQFRREMVRKWIISNDWRYISEHNIPVVFSTLMSELTLYVSEHPESWPLLKKYIEQADSNLLHSAIMHNKCGGWMCGSGGGLTGAEAWLFCRDLRFSLPREEIPFLAEIDERYRCGFTQTCRDRILIPFNA